MAELTRSYRIDRQTKNDGWRTIMSGFTDEAEAERSYGAYRNSYPGSTYRLVCVVEHVYRSGKGKVYD